VSLSSKLRMALVGLTAVALVGGVMSADPAMAGKKKKKKNNHHHSSVVQVSKGGNARGGNGGHGGEGGDSGNVANTGNVTGGPRVGFGPLEDCVRAVLPFGPGPVPGFAAALAAALTASCGGPLPAAFIDCLVLRATPAPVVPESAFFFCADLLPGGGVPGPGPFGSGVFSGRGGDGGTGGNGGAALAGNGGNNTNSSSVTVASDDHSIDVDD
jgi:hypothetical protein